MTNRVGFGELDPFDDAAEKSVFLPPMAVDSASEERAVRLPSSLADAVAFLHPAVDLIESTRRSRTEIAEMLRKGGLAKAYDTEQVARALAAAAQDEVPRSGGSEGVILSVAVRR